MPRLCLIIAFLTTLLWLCCPVAHAQSRSSRLPATASFAPDGVLEPWRICDVACVETGLVKQIFVERGAQVTAGQPLAELDSRSLELQLAVAEAQAAAVGRQSSARAEVELNERKVAAIRDARQFEYSSQLELERAEADLRISQGRLLSEVEEQRVLQLQVERLRQQLAQRTVLAPFDGVIVELHKEIGEFVAPNTPEVVRIVDVSRLRTSFFLQEQEVKALPSDGQLSVQLNDGGVVRAQLEQVAPVADSESGLIEVRVLVDNPKLEIHGSRCSLLLDARAQ